MRRIVKILVMLLAVTSLCGMSVCAVQGAEFLDFLTGGEGRIEGSGAETKEDAVRIYIEGLVEQNVPKMLSACAVETYAKNYRLDRQIDNIGNINFLQSGYLPNNGDFSFQLNVENRREQLVKMIRYQYLTMTKSKAQTAETITMEGYDSGADMVADMFGEENLEIRFDGDIFPGCLITGRILSYSGLDPMGFTAYIDGAERIDCMAALLWVNEELYYLTLGVERYDGKWYVTPFNHLANLIGLDYYCGGMQMVAGDIDVSPEEYREGLDSILHDEELNTVLGKVDQALDSLDIEAIFSSTPREIWGITYEDAYDAAFAEYLSPDELAFFEALRQS